MYWLRKLDFLMVKVFSVKKISTVNQAYNHCNNHVIIDQGESAMPVSKTKHPSNVVVLRVVAFDGYKFFPIFVPARL